MARGRARRSRSPARCRGLGPFLERFRAQIVAVAGAVEGTEIPIEQGRTTLGRGPGADVAFDDESLSRQHAVLEFAGDGFRIRDLDSVGGVLVNGRRVAAAPLQHGDRFTLGAQTFELSIEKRDASPPYVLHGR